MHNKIDSLFSHLWQDYLTITPSAKKVHDLLEGYESEHLGKSAKLGNDHIALRSFNIEKINLDKLAAHFLALGYTEQGQYDFIEKKLRAKHFEHADETQPKVFISELIVEEMPPIVQQIIQKMTDDMDDNVAQQDNFLYSGTHWQISTQEYETLVAHSEYAAWMSAWGFRANHFTVSLNHMGHFKSLAQMNTLLKESGFVLNNSGGEIKGGPEVLLAQSSTMADQIEVEFSNGKKLVPSCFYEFSQRYKMPTGKLYQGFVAASADKIFESTNTQ
ncbi:DUF1338 domain-containing protein [uncultured Paraglaciecola sp.]|jgi:hypothetical protein|uniref:DUF1338 domain-containing protein n=1 Tax=uncultured Paraglaciecola sp. TaxID=1765024 RepID=UPI0025E59EB8|nr:DUF1338 domain-containing protein [uncultured Paraglaciecola sp.]